MTRRTFIAGAAAVGASTYLSKPRAVARSRGKHVAVFGGGMSGLATAHELIERGFSVDVFDARRIMGGKARSFGVPGSQSGGRRELPAEHGFRFFPGFYRNVPDSMRRIPFRGNNDGVLGNLRDFAALVDDRGFGAALSSGPGRSFAGSLQFDAATFQRADAGRLGDPGYLAQLIGHTTTQISGVPANRFPLELADFARCIATYVTSCVARRETQWDRISWWDFLGADRKSALFQGAIARATTMGLVAVKPEICSVNSAGNIVEAFLWNLLLPLPGPDDAFVARLLNGPTSDVWIDPWVQELTRLGVRFHGGQALHSLDTAGGAISSATVIDGGGSGRRVDADFYVSAVPVERAVDLLRTPDVLRLDPALDAIKDLRTDWMNGLMIYLRRPLEVAKGVFAIEDHPWTLSAVSQGHAWSRDIASEFGDGTVNDIISVDISNWDGVGTTVIKKPARDCSRDEIFTEVWATFKARFGGFDPSIADDNVQSWFLDPAISWDDAGRINNAEPLTVQTVNTWAKRPKGPTAVPNLFVAGDWIQTNANVVSMEGANQGGRIAAQAVLDASGRNADRVVRFDYYVPPQLDGLKALDAERFAAGQPNLFG